MVLMAGVAFWSFGTLVAPPAAHFSLAALCISRVLVSSAIILLTPMHQAEALHPCPASSLYVKCLLRSSMLGTCIELTS